MEYPRQCREKWKAYQKSWNLANPEKRKSILKRCKTKYKDKYYLTTKAWRQENAERYKATQRAWDQLYGNAKNAKRRALKLRATPAWADLEAIKQFYANCPEGYHVDHIIPLKGKNVCGLHVLNNLQYLPAKENLQKSNKYDS